jgi:hypothetical protein
VTHYDAPGAAVAWTREGEKWSRDIPGLDGTLTAVQTNTETTLQVHDLRGDAVATAALSTEATKLVSTYNSTEFGVPSGSAPPKYAWLGGAGIASERSTGIVTEGATSYIPQIGKPLQNEEVEPPGLPGGSGAGTPYSFEEDPWNLQGAGREAAEAPGLEAGREREAAEAACRANITACPNYEDPVHNILLVTPRKATEWGDALCGCTGIHDVGKVIEEIANEIGVGGLGEVFEEVLESGPIETFGKQLKYCGEYTSSNPANRCAIELHTAGLKTPFGTVDTYIPTGISVGPCYFYKKSYKGMKRGLHCPNGAYYKPGGY